MQVGGAGKSCASGSSTARPEWDLWAFDPRRYTGYATTAYTIAKAVELYQNEYAIGFPFEERPAGRPAQTTPLYPVLPPEGAAFGARNGWERATWFRPAGEIDGADAQPAPSPQLARPGPRRECRTVREAVAVIDLGGFTKFGLSGQVLRGLLDRLLCRRLPPVGRDRRSPMRCAAKGGVAQRVHGHPPGRGPLLPRRRQHRRVARRGPAPCCACRPMASARLDRQCHGRLGTLVVAGPAAREVLQEVTAGRSLHGRLSLALCPRDRDRLRPGPGAARQLRGRARLGAAPADGAASAGLRGGLAAGATRGSATSASTPSTSLRLDKCYRSWKQDLETGFSAFEAGLDRFVDLTKPDFVGKAALLAERDRGVRQRLVPLILDEPGEADVPFCAPVHARDERVGLATSGFWSFTLERSVALAYVRADLAVPGSSVEVEIYGRRSPATVGAEPLYDPENARLRA